jgi:hypothetical protein
MMEIGVCYALRCDCGIHGMQVSKSTIEVFTAVRRPWEDKNERRVRGNMVMAAVG